MAKTGFLAHDVAHMSYLQSFKTLASLFIWFESYLVANTKDRFSRDKAHSFSSYVLLFLPFLFSLCFISHVLYALKKYPIFLSDFDL